MIKANPIQVPPRFEIRKLEAKHIPWADAIITHSNVYHSPVWSVLYPDAKTQRCYDMFKGCERMMKMNVDSGLSYGVFDTEYKYKRPESAAEGGKLYWGETNPDATGEDLIDQMDFPLVSIAMAYDGADPRDGSEWGPLIELMPRFKTLFGEIEGSDKRDPATWTPKALGEVVYRGGTATRRDYEGFGLARVMGNWLMHEVAGRGFKAMQVGAAHGAIESIFLNPPAPFTAEKVGVVDTLAYEEDGDDGQKVNPFAVCGAVPCSKIWVNLE